MKIAALLLFFCFTFATLTAQYDVPLTVADQMPYFTGCDRYAVGSKEKRSCSNQNLVNFIAQNLNYPALAKSEGVEGTVYVSFVVAQSGAVGNAEVLYDIGGDCGREALRVVNSMPDFVPGVHQGEAVKVKLNLPVKFALKDGEENKAADFFLTWGALKGNNVTRSQLTDNLKNEVTVRDRRGDTALIDELIFSYEKGDKRISEKSRGTIDEDLEKVITKVKKGGVFTVSAIVQTGGEFIYIDRSFTVTE